jgi:hypothetical protein
MTRQLTPQEKEDYRKAEASFKADVFANPRDASRAIGDESAQQMTLAQSVSMFTHTSITGLDMVHELYRHAEFFGIDNKIKV